MTKKLQLTEEKFRKKLPFVSKLIDNQIVKIVLFPIAILLTFVLSFFEPLIFQLFNLIEFFQTKEPAPNFLNKFILIPATILSVSSYGLGAIVLGFWYLIATLSIFDNYFGFIGFIVAFFLPQIALVSAPFIVLYKSGVPLFAQFITLVLIIILYGIQEDLIFPREKTKTPLLVYLNHSPWIFIAGAFSTQTLGISLLGFIGGFKFVGGISNQSFIMWILAYMGLVFMILALISAIIWLTKKKSMNLEEKGALYKPSIWILISSYILLKLFGDETPSAVPLIDIVIILLILKRILWLPIIFCKRIRMKTS